MIAGYVRTIEQRRIALARHAVCAGACACLTRLSNMVRLARSTSSSSLRFLSSRLSSSQCGRWDVESADS